MATRLLAIPGGPKITAVLTLYQFLGYSLLVVATMLTLRLLAPVFRRTP